MTRKVAVIKRQQQMAESVGVQGDDDTHLSVCPPPLRRGESSGDGCGQMRISLNVLRENLTIN